jgi:mRNA-degrading endonuclease YafQ of YafQ-DinJ toxin-antitoxin module
VRAARKAAKGDAGVTAAIHTTLTLLEQDAFYPLLRTHKLRGKLQGSWACSAGYDLRVVFRFVELDGVETVLLESVGTHDEVY